MEIDRTEATGDPPGPARAHDPEGTRRDIIEVATQEFARNGYSGSRIDDIAARTRSSKRMIYYYFGDKEGLYVAVLEAAYQRVREIEARLDLDHLDPVRALETLVGFTFDHHDANPDFIRLVMTENIHHGAYIAKSDVIKGLNVSVIDAIRRLYRRGVEQGRFRDGIDPVELHWAISALCFFNVSNRATFSTIFEARSGDAAVRRRNVVDIILRYVLAQPDPRPA